MQDFSGLRFEGMLTISGTCNIEGISRLPHCKKVNFHGRVTEKELLILHPETEELLCPDTFDLDMLPTGSRLKYISLNSNFYHRKRRSIRIFCVGLPSAESCAATALNPTCRRICPIVC